MSLQQILLLFTTFVVMIMISMIQSSLAITPIGPRINNLKNSWTIGNSSPENTVVHFEMFLDLTCPDCATHFQTITKPLLYYYFNYNSTTINNFNNFKNNNDRNNNFKNKQENNKITFSIHFMPLPMHIAGFYSAQTYSIISKYAKADKNICFKFLNLIFTNQSLVSNVNLKNLNQLQIFKLIYTNFVQPTLGGLISYEEYLNEMNNQSTSFIQAASMFGYATSRGLYGTPFFFVNGVNVFNGQEFMASDWIAMIDGIIKSTSN
ncbi:hypothetical protein ABK040_016345 [Willaertia magna]